MKTKVVCIEGDGIGPEVTRAMKAVVAATGAPIEWVDMPAGLAALAKVGDTLPQATLDAIAECRLAIKGPTNTPKGEGHSSVNVRLRQIFDLYAGIRPYVSPPFPGLDPRDRVDLILFRQNTEGLYACTEELVTGPDGPEVRLGARFTARAMERLARYAFEVAKRRGRKRATIVTKSNIHKAWGKLYRDAFMKVAADYPEIAAEEMLVDATAMTLAANVSRLDVIVTENMFGDILSDQCAGEIGGLGVAPGANIGDDCAIFEAVHGSADDIAGKDLANPTALILSAALLLDHAGYAAEADGIRAAVNAVIAEGGHVTGDLLRSYPAGAASCGTGAFTGAVVARVTPTVSLTEKAAKKVVEIAAAEGVAAGQVLRLAVRGGGCSGFTYELFFDAHKPAIDRVFVFHGVTIVVDQMSLAYLAGTVVDYVDGLSGSGFKFTNPNVKSTCGCGESFSA